MLQLHQQLKAGRFPNCRKLADELEVSSKTIQRDIEFMRYQLGFPVDEHPVFDLNTYMAGLDDTAAEKSGSARLDTPAGQSRS